MNSTKWPRKKVVKRTVKLQRKHGAATRAKIGGKGARPATARKTKKPTAKTKRKVAATPKAKRKPLHQKAVWKAALEIPPILLEGDTSSAPVISGPGQRYALSPALPPKVFEPAGEDRELPEAYGTKELLLVARDPHWLYAHWDLSREQQRGYNTRSADGHLVLRVYVDAIGGPLAAQVHVHPESRHWFVHVERGGMRYLAELGYNQPGGKWVTISVSGTTLTPPDNVSTETTVQFATLPVDIPLKQLAEMVKTLAAENIPLADAIQQLRVTGHPELPDASAFAAKEWTPEQERALAEAVSMDQVRRVWIGSLEITELVRRQLERGISSISAAQLGLPTSPVGAVSSISSLFGGERAHAKGFWFNINAELVIYGATEPDAKVTLAGRRVKLRPDGTFSHHYALPDGQYDLSAVAISADETDGRAAELKFSRTTEYRGDVGVQPQDLKLKPPPENV